MSYQEFDMASYRMEEAAEILLASSDPQRKAFGRLLKKCANACLKIYKVDGGDMSEPVDTDAINEALGKNAKALVLAELVEQATGIAMALDYAIREAQKVKP